MGEALVPRVALYLVLIRTKAAGAEADTGAIGEESGNGIAGGEIARTPKGSKLFVGHKAILMPVQGKEGDHRRPGPELDIAIERGSACPSVVWKYSQSPPLDAFLLLFFHLKPTKHFFNTSSYFSTKETPKYKQKCRT